MFTEDNLAWIHAAAFFCVFVWVFSVAVREALSREASFSKSIAGLLFYGGFLVFLYWIVFGASRFGIDHIRPLGLPLGLWGFGVAGAAGILAATRK